MFFIKWLLSKLNPLDKLFDFVNNNVDEETKRLEIKSQMINTYLTSQMSILTGRGWWFPLLFAFPVAFHWGAINFYSILWCKGCIFPQTWTIAALPKPMDEWEGFILSSMFIGWSGKQMIDKWRNK